MNSSILKTKCCGWVVVGGNVIRSFCILMNIKENFKHVQDIAATNNYLLHPHTHYLTVFDILRDVPFHGIFYFPEYTDQDFVTKHNMNFIFLNIVIKKNSYHAICFVFQ